MNQRIGRGSIFLIFGILSLPSPAQAVEIDFHSKIYRSTQEVYAVQEFGKAKTVPYRFNPESSARETVYVEDRENLHKRIVKQLLRGKKRASEPQFIITGGIPGSGKTSILNALDRSGIISIDSYVNIDKDLVKSLLPEASEFQTLAVELQKEKRSENVNDLVLGESNDISLKLLAAALERGYPIIYDTTLKNGAAAKHLIKIAQAYGYRATVVKAEIDPAIAWERTISRAESECRFIPRDFFDSTIIKVNSAVSNLSETFKKYGVDSWEINNDHIPTLTACYDEKGHKHPLAKPIALDRQITFQEFWYILGQCGPNIFTVSETMD